MHLTYNDATCCGARGFFCEVRNADFGPFYKIGPKTGFRKFLMQMQGLSARAKNNYIHVHIDSYMHTDRHIPCGMYNI